MCLAGESKTICPECEKLVPAVTGVCVLCGQPLDDESLPEAA